MTQASGSMAGGRVSRPRHGRVSAWIRDHPLISYFAMTFAISWTITFAARDYLDGLYSLAPFIAAVAITSLGSEVRADARAGQRLPLWALATAGSYGAWILALHYFAQKAWSADWILGGLVASAVVSWLLTCGLSSRSAVRDLVRRLYAWRVDWRWYAFAVFFWPAAYGLGMALDAILGGQAPDYPYSAPSVAGILLAIVWIGLWGGGLEEVGWRGFALPRLQIRHSPLTASLVVGFFWALWHTPEYYTGQYTSSSGTGPAAIAGILARFVLYTPPLTVLFTWIYNRTHGNLLLPVLAHTSFNVGTAVLAISSMGYLYAFLLMWVAAAVVVIRDRMWRLSPVPPGGPLTTEHSGS